MQDYDSTSQRNLTCAVSEAARIVEVTSDQFIQIIWWCRFGRGNTHLLIAPYQKLDWATTELCSSSPRKTSGHNIIYY